MTLFEWNSWVGINSRKHWDSSSKKPPVCMGSHSSKKFNRWLLCFLWKWCFDCTWAEWCERTLACEYLLELFVKFLQKLSPFCCIGWHGSWSGLQRKSSRYFLVSSRLRSRQRTPFLHRILYRSAPLQEMDWDEFLFRSGTKNVSDFSCNAHILHAICLLNMRKLLLNNVWFEFDKIFVNIIITVSAEIEWRLLLCNSTLIQKKTFATFEFFQIKTIQRYRIIQLYIYFIFFDFL